MAIYKDKIIVVDAEATCWKGYDAPDGQENEIIEIGVCLLTPDEKHIGEKHSIMVTPEQSTVSEFCTELTGITQHEVDEKGISFENACARLENEFNSRNRLWASWGNWDRRIFKSQCKKRNVRYPFNKKHSNLKRVFQDAYGERLSLAKALKAAEIEPEGKAHRGDDDAYNTARLLLWLLNKYGDKILYRAGW